MTTLAPGGAVAATGAAPVAAPFASRLAGFHPGWYGAVMGTAVVGMVAYQNPGAVAAVAGTAHAAGVFAVGLAAVLAVLLLSLIHI